MTPSNKDNTFAFEYGEEMEVKVQRQKRRPYISGRLIGEVNRYNKKGEGYPFIQTVVNMNGAERWFFKILLTELEKEKSRSVLIVDTSSYYFNKSDANRRSAATKSLTQKELIKKVSRGKYIFNPMAFIDYNSHEANMIKWEAIK